MPWEIKVLETYRENSILRMASTKQPERFVILIMSWLLGKLENHDIKGALSLAAPPLCSLIRQMLQPEGAALSGVNC